MSVRRSLRSFAGLGCSLALAWTAMFSAMALEPSSNTARPATNQSAPKDSEPPEPHQRDEQFRKMVTNMKLTGHFTLDGHEDEKLRREEYVIRFATKVGNGDVWLLTSRIRYGEHDLTVPVPVQVKWAGDTPVITVDNVGIPGLGMFSARVVLDQGRYAGTWSHDKVGGHMFGRIVPAVPDVKDATRSGSQPTVKAPAESTPAAP